MANSLPGLLGDNSNAGAIMRAIQKRALRGLDPTHDQAAWLTEQGPRLSGNADRMADMLTPFPAIGEAVADPSLANVTNAAVRMAGTAGKPLAALGLLGGGYGIAGARDLGLFDSGANAQTAAQSRARAGEAKAKAQAEADVLRARTEAERQGGLLRTQEADAAVARAAREKDRGEYDRAVMKAESGLADADASHVKRFAETAIGQMYDKAGIAAPFFGVAGVNAVTRAAMGKAGGLAKDWVIPGALGTLEGAVMANWPLGHEVLFQPAYNPEKQKYQDYARDLPPTHPRKQEWTDYAGRQPTDNPARAAAVEEFYHPGKMLERSLIGGVEGLTGGITGAKLAKVPGVMGKAIGDVVEGSATLPGRAAQGYNRGMTGAGNEKLLRDFTEIKNKIAEAKGFRLDAEAEAALAAARARAGAAPPTPVMPPVEAPPMPTVGAADTPAGRARRYLNSY